MRYSGSFIIAILIFLVSVPILQADDYLWVIGKWQLVHDPDDGQTDYIHFLDDGDVISSGPAGQYEGFYIASYGVVKAVLSIEEKDLILTFHHNDENTELYIVTSESGQSSVYRKVE